MRKPGKLRLWARSSLKVPLRSSWGPISKCFLLTDSLLTIINLLCPYSNRTVGILPSPRDPHNHRQHWTFADDWYYHYCYYYHYYWTLQIIMIFLTLTCPCSGPTCSCPPPQCTEAPPEGWCRTRNIANREMYWSEVEVRCLLFWIYSRCTRVTGDVQDVLGMCLR